MLLKPLNNFEKQLNMPEGANINFLDQSWFEGAATSPNSGNHKQYAKLDDRARYAKFKFKVTVRADAQTVRANIPDRNSMTQTISDPTADVPHVPT